MGLGLGLSSSGGGGNSVVNKAVFVNASATGTITTLAKLLSSTSTLSRISTGSNANLTLSGVNIQATAALGVGVSQVFVAQEDAGDGRVIQYRVTCTGAPVAASLPSVTLTPGDGQISVAWTDGSNGGATITSHNIYLDGVLIASPTSASPYVITGLTNGVSYAVRVSAVNSAGESALSTSQSAIPQFLTLPAMNLMVFDGNSLSANTGGRGLLGTTTLIVTSCCSSTGRIGYVAPLSGNMFLLDEGFQHAVGGTSSEGAKTRARVASMANLGNDAAFNVTGLNADKNYSGGSGGRSIGQKPGKYVLIGGFIGNDDGATNLPTKDYTASLNNLATYVDERWADGIVTICMTDTPRGPGVQRMESKTVSGGTWTITYPVGFVDGESFGSVGVVGLFADGYRPMTKVASAPGQDQYTVSGAGVYVAGGTAPTQVWVTYNGSTSGSLTTNGTKTHHRIYTEYVLSSASNFVSSVTGRDFGIPGLQYNRPYVIPVDAWTAFVDPASPTKNALPGLVHDDETHVTQVAALHAGKLVADKLKTLLPAAPRLDNRPTRNNWYADRGTGATSSFSGTLPPTMRSAFTGGAVPTLISSNGAVIGKVDLTTGAISGTGVASGTLDFATGIWSLTTTSNSVVVNNGQLFFEQDIGNWDYANMLPGTIGRNAVMNGLLDMTPAVGSKLVGTVGIQSAFPSLSAGSIPYGWTLQHVSGTALATAITNGTAFMSVVTGLTDADGFPLWTVELSGAVPGATPSLQLVQSTNNPGPRLVAGKRPMVGANIRHSKHGTIGRMYGTWGAQLENANTGVAVSRDFPSSPASTSAQTNTGITGLTSRMNNGAPTLFIDDAILAKSQALGITPAAYMEMYQVGAMVDTTGYTYSTASARINLAYTSDVPMALRLGVGRVQLRYRDDMTF